MCHSGNQRDSVSTEKVINLERYRYLGDVMIIKTNLYISLTTLAIHDKKMNIEISADAGHYSTNVSRENFVKIFPS